MQSGGNRSSSGTNAAIEMYGGELDPPTHEAKSSSYGIDQYSLYNDDVAMTTVKNGHCMQQLLGRLWTFYSDQLESNPIRTKSLTAGTLNVVGDLLAQAIELSFDDETYTIDGWRVLAMFIEGLCFSGPSMHFAYELFERVFPIVSCDCVEPILHEDDVEASGDITNITSYSKTKWKNVLIHVAFDEIIMNMWYVAGLMIITCVIEGHSSELVAELENDYLRNLGASWLTALFFAPIQFFAFGKLASQYRVLAVNLIDVVWITVMSTVTHLNRGESKSFVKSILIPMLSWIGDNIVDST